MLTIQALNTKKKLIGIKVLVEVGKNIIQKKNLSG
tara:strand:+ start:435 stop:539 length:105 start_codon:yes stop_codon:yes gene_type:complete